MLYRVKLIKTYIIDEDDLKYLDFDDLDTIEEYDMQSYRIEYEKLGED